MKHPTYTQCAVLAAIAILPTGCGEQAPDGPPTVRLGDTLCDECNMIISDERFVTSTIVDGPRGPEPRLFDDYICQANYESTHPDLRVLTRWSHDYTNAEWIDTDKAFFLISDELHAPMASHAAATTTKNQADQLQNTLGGEIVSFQSLWSRLQSRDRTPPQATPKAVPSAPPAPTTDSPSADG